MGSGRGWAAAWLPSGLGTEPGTEASSVLCPISAYSVSLRQGHEDRSVHLCPPPCLLLLFQEEKEKAFLRENTPHLPECMVRATRSPPRHGNTELSAGTHVLPRGGRTAARIGSESCWEEGQEEGVSRNSQPVLVESGCRRVQNSWLGPKIVAQAIG